MPKDYAKFVPPKSRLNMPQRLSAKWIVAVAVLMILAGAGAYYYIATSGPADADFITKISALLHHKKTPLKETIKLASAQPPEPRTVRFDFYEELPNMQMPGDPPTVSSAPAPVPVTTTFVSIAPKIETPVAPEPALVPEIPAAPVVAAAKPEPELEPKPKPAPVFTPKPEVIPAAVKAKPAQPSSKPAPVQAAFNPDELTHLLEKERPKSVPIAAATPAAPVLGANKYILQMGDFDTEIGARGFVSAIKSVGFDARVVKVSRSGRTIYQVLQGPFESMALATQSQQRMQKRGLISTILKTI